MNKLLVAILFIIYYRIIALFSEGKMGKMSQWLIAQMVERVTGDPNVPSLGADRRPSRIKGSSQVQVEEMHFGLREAFRFPFFKIPE